MNKLSIFLISIFFFILASCLETDSNSDEIEFVTFQITVNKEIFSEKALLRVRLYTEEQLQQLEEQASCSISYDQQTEIEEISCPDGVEYQKIHPEEFTFSVQEIENQIEVKSVSVQTGKKYQLSISGLYKDNCNTTSGGITEFARSQTIKLDELTWYTTEMGCVSNG